MVIVDNQDYENDYEDDFEDYEDDDFEDYESDDNYEDQKESSSITSNDVSLTNIENSDVKRTQHHYTEVTSKSKIYITPATESPEARKQKDLRTRLRLKKWKELIELDGGGWKKVGKKGKTEKTSFPKVNLSFSPTCCLLKLDPLSSQEISQRGLGCYANMMNAASQVDIFREENTQTTMFSSDCSVQVPDDYLSYSRPQNAETAMTGSRKKNVAQSRVHSLMSALSKTDLNLRLSAMLRRTLPLLHDALNDGHENNRVSTSLFDTAGSSEDYSNTTESEFLSKDSVTLSLQAYVEIYELTIGRSMVSMTYSHSRSQLLVAYGEREINAEKGETVEELNLIYKEEGIALIWDLCNLDEQGRPQLHGLLICQCSLACACWGPFGTGTIVAGLNNGAIAVWDLADSCTTTSGQDEEYAVKVWRESATSEYRLDKNVGRIVSIACRADLEKDRKALNEISNEFIKVSKADINKSIISFSVISTDEFVHVTSWTVSIMLHLDTLKSTMAGTRIGSRTSIIHVSDDIKVGVKKAHRNTSGLATCIKMIPDSGVQFVVGTTSGLLLRGAQFGKAPAPRSWTPDFSDTNTFVDFTSKNIDSKETLQTKSILQGTLSVGSAVNVISFSPFLSEFLAIAYSSGHLAIFSLKISQQILLISDYTDIGIKDIEWSPSCPSSIIVLDQSSTIHFYDILERLESECLKTTSSLVKEVEPGPPSRHAIKLEHVGNMRVSQMAVCPALLPTFLRNKSLVASLNRETQSALDKAEKTIAFAYEDGEILLKLIKPLHSSDTVKSRSHQLMTRLYDL